MKIAALTHWGIGLFALLALSSGAFGQVSNTAVCGACAPPSAVDLNNNPIVPYEGTLTINIDSAFDNFTTTSFVSTPPNTIQQIENAMGGPLNQLGVAHNFGPCVANTDGCITVVEGNASEACGGSQAVACTVSIPNRGSQISAATITIDLNALETEVLDNPGFTFGANLAGNVAHEITHTQGLLDETNTSCVGDLMYAVDQANPPITLQSQEFCADTQDGVDFGGDLCDGQPPDNASCVSCGMAPGGAASWVCNCDTSQPECASGTAAECDWNATTNSYDWSCPGGDACTGNQAGEFCCDNSTPQCDANSGNWLCGDNSVALTVDDCGTTSGGGGCGGGCGCGCEEDDVECQCGESADKCEVLLRAPRLPWRGAGPTMFALFALPLAFAPRRRKRGHQQEATNVR